MVTIKLARAKQNVLFQSPSSPQLTIKKRLLKKSLQKTFSGGPSPKKEKNFSVKGWTVYSAALTSTSTLTGTDSL